MLRLASHAPKPDNVATKFEPRDTECSSYFTWQPTLNQVLGLVLLVPALPIVALLWVLVRSTSRGPAFYRQVRVGLHGKTFDLIKIRTMRQDAESSTGPVWTEPNDPRVTFVGRVLRAVHLDELPQLINVIKGEMALIGPRPERPEFVEFLVDEIPGYMDRYAVRPGITGLAQINLPPDTDVDSVRRKIVLDMQYVKEASFGLEMRIFLCTATRLIGLDGLVAAKLLGIRCQPSIPDAYYPEDARKETQRVPAVERRMETIAAGNGNGLHCVATLAADRVSAT